jgi:hypothetical protein
VGEHRPIVWGGELSDEKIYIIKYTAALKGCRLMILNATTNQKEGDYVGKVRQAGGMGEAQFHCVGGVGH